MDELLQRIDKVETKLNTILKGVEELKERGRYQSIPKASEILGISEKKLRQYCDEGIIPCQLVSTGESKYKRYLINIPATQEWVNQGGIVRHHINTLKP